MPKEPTEILKTPAFLILALVDILMLTIMVARTAANPEIMKTESFWGPFAAIVAISLMISIILNARRLHPEIYSTKQKQLEKIREKKCSISDAA